MSHTQGVNWRWLWLRCRLDAGGAASATRRCPTRRTPSPPCRPSSPGCPPCPTGPRSGHHQRRTPAWNAANGHHTAGAGRLTPPPPPYLPCHRQPLSTVVLGDMTTPPAGPEHTPHRPTWTCRACHSTGPVTPPRPRYARSTALAPLGTVRPPRHDPVGGRPRPLQAEPEPRTGPRRTARPVHGLGPRQPTHPPGPSDPWIPRRTIPPGPGLPHPTTGHQQQPVAPPHRDLPGTPQRYVDQGGICPQEAPSARSGRIRAWAESNSDRSTATILSEGMGRKKW